MNTCGSSTSSQMCFGMMKSDSAVVCRNGANGRASFNSTWLSEILVALSTSCTWDMNHAIPGVFLAVLEREDHVVRGQRLAVVPEHTVTQGEGPGEAVVGMAPVRGQPGDGIPAGIAPDQAVEEQRGTHVARPTVEAERGWMSPVAAAGQPQDLHVWRISGSFVRRRARQWRLGPPHRRAARRALPKR